MIKKVFKITDMHCTACAISIDGELEDTDGVVSAATSYAKGQVEVSFDEMKVNDKKITGIIKELGYTALPS